MNRNRRVQYLAAFAVSIASMATGFAYYWTAPILPKFINNETSINLTRSEVSWVVAIISPGTVVGSLVASYVSDKFGRRVTLLGSALTYIVGTIFILCATKAWMLYMARFFWGCGTGFIANVSSIYLSEISAKEIRGTLTACTRFMFVFGLLLVMATGSFVTFQALSYWMIALPVCYFIACWWIPESPYYLLKEGNVDAARKELLKLCGSKDEKMVETELSLMRSNVRKEMLRSSSVKELFTGKQYRKAVIITIGLRITQLMAGMVPIQQYLGRIIQESNSGMKLSTALIIFGAVRFVVGLISPIIVDKVGRRPLLIYSYLGVCAMLSSVGAYFFLQRVIGINDEASNPFRFVVIIGLICALVMSSMGFDTLIFIIPSEIFPINVRSIAMTMSNIFTAFVAFVVVKGYQLMVDWVDLYGVFWFYASMSFSGAVFTYFVVPETKGKTLEEIQVELQGNMYDEAGENLRHLDVDENNQNTELKDMACKR